MQEKKEREGVMEEASLPQRPVYPQEKTEAFLGSIREREPNLHALNELLEVLISLPRALREGD